MKEISIGKKKVANWVLYTFSFLIICYPVILRELISKHFDCIRMPGTYRLLWCTLELKTPDDRPVW
jgi:hypothetical protein